MRLLKHIASLLSLIAFGLMSGPAPAAEIVIASPSTPYSDAIFAITKVILKDRFGVAASQLTTTAPVAWKSMDADRGDLIVGTAQLPNSQSLVDEYVTKKGTVILAPNSWEFQQGFCTIKPVADKYGIKTIYDLTRPEIVQLTAKPGDNKGEIWVGGAEWNSTAIDKVRARYYGLPELYNLTTSQADLEYARVMSAIKTGTPIFWSCDSASNFIFPKGATALLTEPAYDAAKWHPVLPSQDPDWYQKSRVDTSWPPVHMYFAWPKRLVTELPEVAHFFEGMKLTPEMVGTWTYATITEKQDASQYAAQWVKDNAATVDGWMAR
jgi:glycine betaine/proline transport system substrate-binding protein